MGHIERYGHKNAYGSRKRPWQIRLNGFQNYLLTLEYPEKFSYQQ